jgi:adenylate cyclase
LLPENPRCKACSAPFQGIGAPLVKILLGKRQSQMDPRFCNQCTDFMRKYPGGAQIEITMVFADVRGSTTLAEKLSPAAFSEVINRFYKATTKVLLQADALIDRLIGDEVVGIYVPGLAGPEHARRAIDSAQELLRVTGHADPEGPWIPVGAGVHTGVSYVGTVGSKSGAMDLTALGDVPNVAARLASLAAPGEVNVSEAACQAANLDTGELERHELSLKGRAQPVATSVIRVGTQ